ncbi:MAG TPA: hypothetical protein DEV93_13000 [Chloroflexi bacterium]|nr:hypothetical protein [Chloroflexota bacterium]
MPVFVAWERVRSVEQSGHLGHELGLSREHSGAVNFLGVIDQDLDRNLQPATKLGLVDRVHINPDAVDFKCKLLPADVAAGCQLELCT